MRFSFQFSIEEHVFREVPPKIGYRWLFIGSALCLGSSIEQAQSCQQSRFGCLCFLAPSLFQSSINSRTHTQGIMRMQMVGTQHTHELVTISLDGVICWWSLDNLHKPIEKISALSGPKKNVILSGFDNNSFMFSFPF